MAGQGFHHQRNRVSKVLKPHPYFVRHEVVEGALDIAAKDGGVHVQNAISRVGQVPASAFTAAR